MDLIDRRLLSALQKDAKTTIQTLAEIAAISTASVQRRLKSLRKAKVIKKEVAVLDPKKLGLGITAVIGIELERDRVDQIDAFKRKAREDSQVMHFYCVAGDCDFIMVVMAQDMEHYEAFTRRFFLADKNVRKYRTSIVVSTEKTTMELPIL
ncbi:Lrp/AsnC family transcriptional regulator [Rhodospirillaceae bacterium RKSG073]|nr:Lrp/AsnC family transcriptional regulator [Curvivirga aplysinae]